jgi:hypothetical protein
MCAGRWPALVLSVPLIGCGMSGSKSFPPPEPAKSMLVALVKDGHARIFAYSLTATTAIRFQDDSRTTDAVYALTYEEPLATNGFRQGEVPLYTGADAVNLPTPNGIYLLDPFHGDGASAWIKESGLSDALTAFRVAPPGPPCDLFQAPVLLDTPLRVPMDLFTVVTSSDAFFADGPLGGPHFVHRSGAVNAAQMSTTVQLAAGARDDHQGLWFCSNSGTTGAIFWSGLAANDALTLSRVATSTAFTCPVFMDAIVSGAHTELLMLGSGGSIDVFDGQTVLHASDIPPDPGGRGGVAWIAPEKGIAVTAGSVYAVVIDGAVVRQVAISSDSDTYPAVARVPGFGVVVTTKSGPVYAFDGTKSSKVGGGGPEVVEMLAVAPYHGGFVYAGSLGSVVEYTTGFCPPLSLGFAALYKIVPLGDDIFVVINTGDRNMSPFGVLRKQ